MAAVGSAVGLGNLVRFPKEMAGQGGAAFLLVYLVLLILVGLPALLGEMSLGKLADMSPVNAFRKMAGSDKSKWAVLGVFGMMAAIFVLFFYTVIGGWALRFFFETFRDGWWDEPTALYGRAAYGPWAILWNLVVSAAMVYIVSRGVSGGIEKASVIMMPTLFAIIIGIVIFAAVKDGAAGFEGMKAVWTPKFSELEVNHISKATGQVFFSLSLGQGAMLTYASYMEKKQSIAKDGTTIAVADTGVAVLAAMMIFPILAFRPARASGREPDGGNCRRCKRQQLRHGVHRHARCLRGNGCRRRPHGRQRVLPGTVLCCPQQRHQPTRGARRDSRRQPRRAPLEGGHPHWARDVQFRCPVGNQRALAVAV